MKKTHLYLLLLCSIAFCGDAVLFDAEPPVRVRIINSLDTLQLSLHGNWHVVASDSSAAIMPPGQRLTIIRRGRDLALLDSSKMVSLDGVAFRFTALNDMGTMGIADVPFGVGWWWGGREDRIYEGDIDIYLDSLGDLCVTVQLPLEEYLKGVVPYEIGGNSPLEALKAQAVAARSEAVIALTSGLYGGERHDLTADVECQVFSGNLRRTLASDRAVEETRSLIISEGGRAMNAFYASNCGGHAELIKNVWPQRQPLESYRVAYPDNAQRKPLHLDKRWRMWLWLRSSPKVYCNPEFEEALPSWSRNNFRWTREFSVADISAMLSRDQDLGSLRRIKVLKRGVSGRIYRARFIFSKGSYDVSGELAIRQLFSPSLRSSAFIVKRRCGRFILSGAGWGHGVGMCQSGAIAQASHGRSFREILTHYYPRAELIQVYALDSEAQKAP